MELASGNREALALSPEPLSPADGVMNCQSQPPHGWSLVYSCSNVKDTRANVSEKTDQLEGVRMMDGPVHAGMLAAGPDVKGMPNLFVPTTTWSLLLGYDVVRQRSQVPSLFGGINYSERRQPLSSGGCG